MSRRDGVIYAAMAGVPALIAAGGGVLAWLSRDWYGALAGIVRDVPEMAQLALWGALCALLAASCVTCRATGAFGGRRAVLYIALAALCAAWPALLFALRSPPLALLAMMGIFVCGCMQMRACALAARAAAFLITPFVALSMCAMAANYAIALLN